MMRLRCRAGCAPLLYYAVDIRDARVAMRRAQRCCCARYAAHLRCRIRYYVPRAAARHAVIDIEARCALRECER